jgi:hypothetical protein
MSREVKGIEEALELLARLNIAWMTINRIQNSLWDRGVAFYGSNHCRVAYYDERANVLAIN